MAPISRIATAQKVRYSQTSTVLNGSKSEDNDGTIVLYRWRIVDPSGTEAVIENPNAPISNLSTLVPGPYQIELVVEDNDFSSSSSIAQIMVVGKATSLKFCRQPSPCSVAGKHLVNQPIASVHNDVGSIVDDTDDLYLSARLLQRVSHNEENSSVSTSFLWLSKVPHNPGPGLAKISDLVLLRPGWFSVQFSADKLVPGMSEFFRIVPGRAKYLEVLGLSRQCFLRKDF